MKLNRPLAIIFGIAAILFAVVFVWWQTHPTVYNQPPQEYLPVAEPVAIDETVTYQGEVQGGECQPTGKCDPGYSPPPFELFPNTAGRFVILTGSTIDLHPYIAKYVEVSGKVLFVRPDGLTTIRVETIRLTEKQ